VVLGQLLGAVFWCAITCCPLGGDFARLEFVWGVVSRTQHWAK